MTRPVLSDKNARRIRWAFFVGAPLLVSCSRISNDERSEYERISRAIDVLREAPNEHKSQKIQPLREAFCEHFCALREQCVGAYEIHITALDLIDRARKKPKLVKAELDHAEQKLRSAKVAATACAAEQARLRRQVAP